MRATPEARIAAGGGVVAEHHVVAVAQAHRMLVVGGEARAEQHVAVDGDLVDAVVDHRAVVEVAVHLHASQLERRVRAEAPGEFRRRGAARILVALHVLLHGAAEHAGGHAVVERRELVGHLQHVAAVHEHPELLVHVPALEAHDAVLARCEGAGGSALCLAALHAGAGDGHLAGSLDLEAEHRAARGELERGGERRELRALHGGTHAQVAHREHGRVGLRAHPAQRVVGVPVIERHGRGVPLERGAAGAREAPGALRHRLPRGGIAHRLPRRAGPRRVHVLLERLHRHDRLVVAVVERLPDGALHEFRLARDLEVLRARVGRAGEDVAVHE